MNNSLIHRENYEFAIHRRNFDITENGVVVVNREMMGQGVQYMPGITPEDMQSA
jgi:ribosomal protein S10